MFYKLKMYFCIEYIGETGRIGPSHTPKHFSQFPRYFLINLETNEGTKTDK